jgi:nucleoside 2-deoxyribosyltransferase
MIEKIGTRNRFAAAFDTLSDELAAQQRRIGESFRKHPSLTHPAVDSLLQKIWAGETGSESEKKDVATSAGSQAGLIFISSSHLDYNLAASVKAELAKFKLEAFVAHKDITVSAEWREEIVRGLTNCDCVIALISEDFRDSEWCNQECGFALALNKPVFTVLLDGRAPRGLLEAYQGLRWDAANRLKSIKDIIGLVVDRPDVPTSKLVDAFVTSESFEDASFAFTRILKRTNLTTQQVNVLGKACLYNRAIFSQVSELTGIGDFIRRYSGQLEADVLTRLRSIPAQRSRAAPI